MRSFLLIFAMLVSGLCHLKAQEEIPWEEIQEGLWKKETADSIHYKADSRAIAWVEQKLTSHIDDLIALHEEIPSEDLIDIIQEASENSNVILEEMKATEESLKRQGVCIIAVSAETEDNGSAKAFSQAIDPAADRSCGTGWTKWAEVRVRYDNQVIYRTAKNQWVNRVSASRPEGVYNFCESYAFAYFQSDRFFESAESKNDDYCDWYVTMRVIDGYEARLSIIGGSGDFDIEWDFQGNGSILDRGTICLVSCSSYGTLVAEVTDNVTGETRRLTKLLTCNSYPR